MIKIESQGKRMNFVGGTGVAERGNGIGIDIKLFSTKLPRGERDRYKCY
jgi:hypothetical protein